MKCFYHQDAEAVGICKQCARGICKECAAERPCGLACRGIHEDQVDSTTKLIDRNVRLSARSGYVNLIAAIVYWGAAFTCGYLLAQERQMPMRLLLAVMAAVMLVSAIANTRIFISRVVRTSKTTPSKT